jgi:hypothetical protein
MLTSMPIGRIAVVLVDTARDVLGPFKSAPNATGFLMHAVYATCPGRDKLPHLSYRGARSMFVPVVEASIQEIRGFGFQNGRRVSIVPPMNVRIYKLNSIAREACSLVPKLCLVLCANDGGVSRRVATASQPGYDRGASSLRSV